ncbi:MAG: hypothetical protein VB092_04965 [Oscillospiraceae bacterium]|nr:hypothetical protein [Oscillospiraceae bacterium]
MKKIGFVTNNKMLAQSLASVLADGADFSLLVIAKGAQAVLDAEILQPDIAVVDADSELGTALHLCGELRRAAPGCRLLFLLSRKSRTDSEIAVAAKKSGRIDDFLFYDSSLDYLVAKLRSM